jgi:hypothetical protein
MGTEENDMTKTAGWLFRKRQRTNFVLIASFLVALSGPSAVAVGVGSEPKPKPQEHAQWERCRTRGADAGEAFHWLIKIDALSQIGGLYGLAHIQGCESCYLQPLWPEESAGQARSQVKAGMVYDADLVFEGITKKGVVLVRVKALKVAQLP